MIIHIYADVQLNIQGSSKESDKGKQLLLGSSCGVLRVLHALTIKISVQYIFSVHESIVWFKKSISLLSMPQVCVSPIKHCTADQPQWIWQEHTQFNGRSFISSWAIIYWRQNRQRNFMNFCNDHECDQKFNKHFHFLYDYVCCVYVSVDKDSMSQDRSFAIYIYIHTHTFTVIKQMWLWSLCAEPLSAKEHKCVTAGVKERLPSGVAKHGWNMWRQTNTQVKVYFYDYVCTKISATIRDYRWSATEGKYTIRIWIYVIV